MTKSYKEVIKLKTFEERFEYLKTDSKVGEETFGYNRYLNQKLYRSPEWKKVRNEVIFRDSGCDLGIADRLITGRVIVHHINPISSDDILERNKKVLDMDNLITVSYDTHNALHFSNNDKIIKEYQERMPNDTTLWNRTHDG